MDFSPFVSPHWQRPGRILLALLCDRRRKEQCIGGTPARTPASPPARTPTAFMQRQRQRQRRQHSTDSHRARNSTRVPTSRQYPPTFAFSSARCCWIALIRRAGLAAAAAAAGVAAAGSPFFSSPAPPDATAADADADAEGRYTLWSAHWNWSCPTSFPPASVRACVRACVERTMDQDVDANISTNRFLRSLAGAAQRGIWQ